MTIRSWFSVTMTEKQSFVTELLRGSAAHTIEDFNQKKLNKDDMRRICLDATIDKIMKFKYVVEENIPIEKWGDLIDQIKNRHRKPPVIMIDYLRKLRTENKTSDERLRVDNILSNLTGLGEKVQYTGACHIRACPGFI